MKRTLNSFLFFILGLNLIANPIATPEVVISELFFNPVSGWQIELEYLNTDQQTMPIDSIWISSSTGKSKLKNFQIINQQGYIIVTNVSLFSGIDIDEMGDSITVSYYVNISGWPQAFQNELIFGNYPNSVISKPKNGQSIALVGYAQYSKDKSPTIGFYNDTLGMCGTVKGNIYDINNQLVSKRTFKLNYEFETSQYGYYSTRLYSNYFGGYGIIYKVGAIYNFALITPISLIMEPDSVVDLDIFLLDSLLVGIHVLKQHEDFPIKLYPNPVSRNGSLNYTIDLPVKSLNSVIELKSIDGKVVSSTRILDNSGTIDLPSQLKDGMLIFNLWINNEIQYSTRIIVTRQ